MALGAFSVVGESLNFARRRFETVCRVAALPLALLLVFNMAATFGYLSVANGRIITFADVAASGANWARVTQIAARAAQSGLSAASGPMWMIYAASIVVTMILVASFMAPLIRYAGLGEKPPRGVLRAPFGADQIRFVLAGVLSTLIFGLVVYAPISFATVAIIAFISQAMKTPYALFPEADSLHTIDIVTGADFIGVRWLHQYQVWGAAALLAAAVVAALLILHLRPRRGEKAAGGFFGRAVGVTTGVALYLALFMFCYVVIAQLLAGALKMTGAPAISGAASVDTLAVILFFAAVIAFAGYFSLQLFPYAGIATCRRSMAFAGTLKVTRRYNLLRLALAFVILGVVLFGAQLLLVWVGGAAALAALGMVASALRSYVRLVYGPEGGEWVFPFFGWIWAVIGILFTMLWTAFTYGVAAGFWGRLYRESEK